MRASSTVSDVLSRGTELRPRARHCGVGCDDAILQALYLLARQREVGLSASDGDLIRPRVDDEQQVAFVNLLIVPDTDVDDVTAHLGCDAHEIGAHRCVVSLRSSLPLQQCDDHGDRRASDDRQAKQPPYETPWP